MTSYLYNKKGYAALIGLLLVVLIIALLVYGGSFFSEEKGSSSTETYIEVEKSAEMQINAIEKNINKQNIDINN